MDIPCSSTVLRDPWLTFMFLYYFHLHLISLSLQVSLQLPKYKTLMKRK